MEMWEITKPHKIKEDSMNDWMKRDLVLNRMMHDAFDKHTKMYQDHADAKRHYLSRSERLHSWEDDSHPIRRHEKEEDE